MGSLGDRDGEIPSRSFHVRVARVVRDGVTRKRGVGSAEGSFSDDGLVDEFRACDPAGQLTSTFSGGAGLSVSFQPKEGVPLHLPA